MYTNSASIKRGYTVVHRTQDKHIIHAVILSVIARMTEVIISISYSRICNNVQYRTGFQIPNKPIKSYAFLQCIIVVYEYPE